MRVACPARGTLLASKRLDAYVSVFKWTLELAGVPVAPGARGFSRRSRDAPRGSREDSRASARRSRTARSSSGCTPPTDPIPGELRVVAGDIEGDSVVSWLKTLVADSFYWTDNDLVVQTRSMYGGVPRDDGATFVLDQGGKVSHFNYFSNEDSAAAIVNALLGRRHAEVPADRTAVVGRRGFERRTRRGVRAMRKRRERQARGVRAAGHSRQQSRRSTASASGWVRASLFGLKRLAYAPGRRQGACRTARSASTTTCPTSSRKRTR